MIEASGQLAEGRGQKTEVGGRKSEIRRQKAEDRKRRSEVRDQKTEDIRSSQLTAHSSKEKRKSDVGYQRTVS